MSNPIIIVENLGKCYKIRHNKTYNSEVTIRDIVAEKIQSLFSSGQVNESDEEAFWALNDVSFEVNQGDRFGLVGGNGAGKSTMLKILSRVVSPTLGRVTIEGRVASLLEVGTGFHPELTGKENIFLNGAILGMSKKDIKAKFSEIVAFSGVEQFLDTPVKRYSSGMYVRLAFSVAAHLDSEILIIDEVLAVGDAAFQQKCMKKMEEISKSGRTILFVSHNMDSVAHLCNKAIYLRNGQIVAEGNPNKIIETYLGQI